ncbi:MAG: 3-hydroxyacyl-CoA dehydrogenase [Hyphomicrobiales bacterium]|nr:3-hydroxyacyl-CoA dehydrogenase [Hyphomicrobiales bacterium]
MPSVAIIGSGFIGRAWAISFARAGHDVVLWDNDQAAPDRAIEFIADVLPDLATNDLLAGATPAALLGRLRIERDLGAALKGVEHVQENAPERVDIKKALFAELDRLAPTDAIIASSTFVILPSRITESLSGRHRCLIIHPINPPYLIPAAEIVPAPWTSPEVVRRAREFLMAAGQAPIVMKRELDGFVMNRMQGALLEEAFRLVADGYATVEDIDVGIRDGLALRWSFMGPFETIDLNAPGGVRDYAERYHGIYKILFGQMQRRVDWEGPVLDEIERARRVELPASQLAERQLWRDRRLMALAAHKRRAAREIGD